MEIVGTDPQGNVYAIQRGLIRSTVYRASRPKAHLSDIDDVGAIDWTQIFSGINSNPLLIGLGQKIAGQGGYGGTVPINAYGGYGSPNVYASGPGFGGAMNPTMIMLLGGGALLLVMMMRR